MRPTLPNPPYRGRGRRWRRPPPRSPRGPFPRWRTRARGASCPSRAATPPSRGPSGRRGAGRRPAGGALRWSRRTSRSSSSAPAAPPRRARTARCARWPWRLPCISCHALAASGRYLDAERSRRTLDHLHRRLDVVGVKVLELELRDLAHLLLADLPDLVLVRLGGALLDAGRFLQQGRGGRRPPHEGEGAGLEDRDLHRDHLPRHRCGAIVVGLNELHDVDAVRAKGGADRRRGGGLSRLPLELDP